jgi:hypothetical protein
MAFTVSSKLNGQLQTNELNKIKIVWHTHVNNNVNEVVDISAYGFNTVYAVTIQSINNSNTVSNMVIGVVKSYSNTSVSYSVLKSKDTTVLLLNTNVSGLEATTGVTSVLTIIGI